MRRHGLKVLRAVLLLAIAGIAGAQSDFEVTMRVVQDARGLDAAVIVIGNDVVETRVDGATPTAQ
jgi:hypothetical protein